MKVSRFASLIPFIVPFNIYLIGNSLGWGVQFPILRVQDTVAGLNTIFIWQEIGLVLGGQIGGRTAISIFLWTASAILLAVAAGLFISNLVGVRRGLIVYGLGCALLVVATMFQYGPFFNGPAGVCIPIGLPFLIVIGYLLWKDANQPDATEEDDNYASSGMPPVALDPVPNPDD
jgi:hypothetical protein